MNNQFHSTLKKPKINSIFRMRSLMRGTSLSLRLKCLFDIIESRSPGFNDHTWSSLVRLNDWCVCFKLLMMICAVYRLVALHFYKMDRITRLFCLQDEIDQRLGRQRDREASRDPARRY